jgi:hypothetical protein
VPVTFSGPAYGQQSNPVIVRLYETPHDPTGLADVLLRALGFTGLLILLAIVTAAAVGGFLYWRRSRTE